MKAVISGLNGFIGSHLSKKLKNEGYIVIPLSQAILYDTLELRKFFDYHNPELIVNCASYGNLHNQTHPSQIIQANIIAVFNMLRESSNVHYKAFIQIGTSSEYGKKNKFMSEDDVVEPETFYAAAKASGTHLASVFAKQYKKPIVTVRPFSVYGPDEPESHLIPILIDNILHGRLTGIDLEALHDWIYIDDLINGIFTVIQNASSLSGQVVNIGIGKESSNQEIVDILTDITQKHPLIAPLENMRTTDSPHWVADGAKLRNLGWHPNDSLQTGLYKTYSYYKKRHDSQ